MAGLNEPRYRLTRHTTLAYPAHHRYWAEPLALSHASNGLFTLAFHEDSGQIQTAAWTLFTNKNHVWRPYSVSTTTASLWYQFEKNIAPVMSQDGGMFSVRRPREVRRRKKGRANAHTKAHELTTIADTRRDQQQCIRDPNARIRHETLDFTTSIRPSSWHSTTYALDIRIAYVARTWKAIAAKLWTSITRREPGGTGTVNGTKTQYSELSRKHGWKEEFCAGHEHASASDTVARKHREKKQCILCTSICRLWSHRPSVLLRDRAAI